jgi:hypothetical protein
VSIPVEIDAALFAIEHQWRPSEDEDASGIHPALEATIFAIKNGWVAPKDIGESTMFAGTPQMFEAFMFAVQNGWSPTKAHTSTQNRPRKPIHP